MQLKAAIQGNPKEYNVWFKTMGWNKATCNQIKEVYFTVALTFDTLG